ncbi:MAG: methyltransferase domain-containing protein [Armatimonadota bacterium]|nr:methyltransferase domain-containing protein [bacterium]MCS7308709.1 methyltransferase domain-containing protein [Armatimonadota bacterium]MDW8103594.1 methyltransferase domain-containing protein [Armatimonadota bacterium]MDW8289204.1 methyltransferase domain-containing protein [Armatimonadota bacterium]
MTPAPLRYPTQTLHIPLGEQTFRVSAVRCIDDLLTDTTPPDDIPFWAVLWHAAVGLSQFLCEHRHLVCGKRVLELGTGLGLCGIVARWLGGKVTVNDYQPSALEFALWNAAQNGLRDLQPLLADWRRFPKVLPFDLVLGADILYERRLHPSLQQVLKQVTGTGSRVLLADPWREVAWEFLVEMERDGWRVDFVERTVSVLGTRQEVIVFELHPP